MNAVAETREPSWIRAATVLAWVLTFAAPFVLYFAITRGRIDEAVILLFAFALLRAVPAVARMKRDKREHLGAALRLPLVAIASAGFALVTREPRALLVLPSASQLAFGAVFLESLRKTPLVEHFARMQAPVLRPAQVRYCRVVTVVWGVTLTTAALVGFALAAWAPIAVWTAFTGVGSYVLVVVLFSGEYLFRKARFREYGPNPIDRMISRLFPAPAPTRTLDLRANADMTEADVTIPESYLFFRGHFEGMPMMPGISELTEVVLPLARRRHPELGALRGLRRVRFRRPVFPGETMHVELAGEAPLNVRFELTVGKHTVANGVLVFDTKAPDAPP